jgi:hypothetical protein
MDLGNYLQNYLMNATKGGLPGAGLYRQQAYGNIDKGINRSVMGQKENLAASGMLRSGAGQQAISDIYASGAGAKGAFESELVKTETDFKNQAISKLLGLHQFQESQPGWLDILGNIISGGAQVGSSALLASGIAASDKKLKQNIKKVGETKSGLPIHEFNYKGSTVKVRGHLAQEIEKKVPKAVYKVLDYNALPKDAVFEVVE